MIGAQVDRSFTALGTSARLIIGRALGAGPPAEEVVGECMAWVEDFEDTLSRFRPASELSRLNADPRETVPVSGLMGVAVAAVIRAAEMSGGLVDATVLDQVESNGYRDSLAGHAAPGLSAILAGGPRRVPAAMAGHRRWRELILDREAGTLTRPPGLRLDLGGIGKGLAADLLTERLHDRERFLVDLGGDIRAGGLGASLEPFEVEARAPGGTTIEHLQISAGAVATSGIDRRAWAHRGGYAHHLVDPSTGKPAWTGVVSATALAPTGLEAEVLAKAALLSGPEIGAQRLTRHGGLLWLDSGEVLRAGPVGATLGPRVRIPTGLGR